MANTGNKSYQPKKDGNAKEVKIKKASASGSSKPIKMPPMKKK